MYYSREYNHRGHRGTYIGHRLKILIDSIYVVFWNMNLSKNFRSLIETEHRWRGFDGLSRMILISAYPCYLWNPCSNHYFL